MIPTEFYPLLAALLPIVVSSLISWRLSRWSKNQDLQITVLEKRTEKMIDLELRLVRQEEKMHGARNELVKLDEAIQEIRETMARREDVEKLHALLLHVLGRARIDRT